MRTFSLLLMFLCAAKLCGAEISLDLGNNVKLPLVLIPHGSFTQGSPGTEASRSEDEQQRSITISRDYYIGKTSVTRAQWEQFIAETKYRTEAESGPSGGFGWDGGSLVQRKEFNWRNPGFAQDGNHPATIITFADAQAFCAWLSRKAKRRVSLPTEAQWEYACRAGSANAWHTQGNVAWHKNNAGNQTHPVSSTVPNKWGLHIGGNVAEWCEDWYGPYDAGSVTDPIQKNSGLSDKPRRVLRGGSWARDPKNTRSAARFRADPGSRNADIGFRVVVSVEEIAAPPPPPVKPTPFVPVQLEETTRKPASTSPGPVEKQELSIFSWAIIAAVIFIFYRILRAVFSGLRSLFSPSGQRAHAGTNTGAVRNPVVRIVEDGFWVKADAVAGTSIQYIYRPQGGMDVSGEIRYQPGNDGHFVYTGAKPENVRIVSGAGMTDSSYTTGNAFDRRRDNLPTHRRTRDEPPRYPSAY